MPDPITPTLPDPQASVDAALGSVPPTSVAPAPVINAPMGDETPLAFAAPTLNAMPAATPTPTAMPEPPKLEPMPSVVGSSYLPPVPQAPISTPPMEDKPKTKSKVMLVVFGIFALLGVLGVGGYFAYQQFGAGKQPEIAAITSQAQCHGCSKPQDGGWYVWRNGECKVTGICNSSNPAKDTPDPVLADATSSNEACIAAGGGGLCSGTDTRGEKFRICLPKGTTKACYQHAIDAGYTMSIGEVKCVKVNNQWVPDPAMSYNNLVDGVGYVNGQTVYQQVEEQCWKQQGSFTGSGNTEMWVCPRGTTVACTANVAGAKRFYGNPTGCFCGVIQVDTGSGHQSYSSTCGCDQEVTPSPSPSTPAAPVLACTGLTQTPSTVPVIGDKVTFTCAGSITPVNTAALTYKFRYSLDGGADQLLANKTNTTAELTINACGTYSVQCKVCATIAGVLKCDPTWTGAVQ